MKSSLKLPLINFIEIKNGNFLSCFHRPQKCQIPILKEKYNLSLLVTVQSEKEQIGILKKICEDNGIIWIHIALEGANLPLLKSKSSQKTIHDGLEKLLSLINTQKNLHILIHCAAGVHRTGVISYSLLRILGENENDSLECLNKMRKETYKGVGEHRILFAESLIIKKYLTSK